MLQKLSRFVSPVCIGIDPHLYDLPRFLQGELDRLGKVSFVEKLTCEILEASTGQVEAVKFQSSFYEALGAKGVDILARCMHSARKAGFFTILDAKRGDIASTMKAYGEAAFEVMQADALTVTPYMGVDVLTPLVPWLKQGRGIFIVWVTSNASGARLQSIPTLPTGDSLARIVLDEITRSAEEHGVKESVGFVCGVTKVSPDVASLTRFTTAPLLMPGLGFQGGSVSAELLSIMREHPGTLIPLSRTLTGLGGVGGAFSAVSNWEEYKRAVETALKEAKSLF